MKYEIVYHPKVPSEVRRIAAEYEKVPPSLANEFWAELTKSGSSSGLHDRFWLSESLPPPKSLPA